MTKRTLHATIQTAVHESSTSSLLGTCRYWLELSKRQWIMNTATKSTFTEWYTSSLPDMSLCYYRQTIRKCIFTQYLPTVSTSTQTVYKRWKNETVSDGEALCKDQWGAHARTQKMSDWLIKKGDFLNVLKMFLLSSEKLLRWEKMC